MLKYALCLALTAAPWAAHAQEFSRTGPFKIDRQPGESIGAAVHRSIIMSAHPRAFGAGPTSMAPRGEAKPNVIASIVSGKIITKSLNVMVAPATPTMSVTYSSPDFLKSVGFEFISPSGYQVLDISYNEIVPNHAGGKIRFSDPSAVLGLFAQAGAWTLNSGYISDFAGQGRNYGASDLTQLFPSVFLNVVNSGTPDSVPPALLGGKLLTPSISLGSAEPFFRAKLAVSDDLSGVSGNVNPDQQNFGIYVTNFTGTSVFLVTPDGSTYYAAEASMPMPVLKGAVTAAIDFGQFLNVPTGTWTIGEYKICDVSGNCIYDYQPDDIKKLFGTTTFAVTP